MRKLIIKKNTEGFASSSYSDKIRPLRMVLGDSLMDNNITDQNNTKSKRDAQLDQAREKNINRSNEFALSNGKLILSLRYNGNDVTSYADIASQLTNKKVPTPKGDTRWSPATVERTCKKYLKLMQITEKDAQCIIKPIKPKASTPKVVKKLIIV